MLKSNHLAGFGGGGGLSTWDLSGATDTGFTLDISGQTLKPTDIQWSDDGTTFFLLGSTGTVYEYAASVAWKISSCSFTDSNHLDDDHDTETSYQIMTWGDSGAKVYVKGIGTDIIYQHTCSTPFDISTASYDSKTSTNHQSTGHGNTQSLAFNPAGTKYFAGKGGEVYQWSLSTPWDISTDSYDSVTFTAENTAAEGLAFGAEGTKIFILTNGDDRVHQWSLPTPYILTSASSDGISFLCSDLTTGTDFTGLAWSADGTQMYFVEHADQRVYQVKT